LPGSDIAPVEKRKGEFYDGLTRWTSELAGGAIGARPLLSVEGETYEEALARANDLFIDRSWGDGLPLWPATRERVDWILRGSSRPRTHVLGAFPPRGGIATVETCAVALAMAAEIDASAAVRETEPLIDSRAQRDSPSPSTLADEGQRAVERRGEVEVRQFELHPPGLDLREVEDVVD